MLIGELYNQGRCDRHSRQLYDSVAGNSGDIFFATCFRQFMIFCAKFYLSAQMATMAIGNANPDVLTGKKFIALDKSGVVLLTGKNP